MLGPDTAPLMLLSPLWLPLPATLGLLPDPDPVCIVWIQPALVTVYIQCNVIVDMEADTEP